jgi:hypothetical protein
MDHYSNSLVIELEFYPSNVCLYLHSQLFLYFKEEAIDLEDYVSLDILSDYQLESIITF